MYTGNFVGSNLIMEKEFIPYEQALALKELGFDEPCFSYYYNRELSFGARTSYGEVVEAPTFSQAFRWFREKYGIFSSVWCFETEQKFFIEFGFGIHKFEVNNKEEAELECLKKLIEIVRQKLAQVKN